MKIFFATFSLLISVNTLAQSVSTDIDSKKLTQVEKWIESAKYDLDIGIDETSKGPISEREERFRKLIVQVLEKSGKKPNEFLMRNLLYRTQVIYSSLQKSAPSEKRDAVSRKVLEEGARWASALYQADLNLVGRIKNKTAADYTVGVNFATLGLEWADFMFGFYYDIPDNKMRFELLKDLMGLMYNDVNNDAAVKKILAPVSNSIVKKNEEIKNLPNIPRTPMEELELARNLYSFIETHLDQIRELLEPYAVNFYGDEFRASPGDVAEVIRAISFEGNPTQNCSRASVLNEKLQIIEEGSKIRFLPNYNSDHFYIEVIETPNLTSPMGAQLNCRGFISQSMINKVKKIPKKEAKNITKIKRFATIRSFAFMIPQKGERLKRSCRVLDRNTEVTLVDSVKYLYMIPTRKSGLGEIFDMPYAETYYIVRVDDPLSSNYGCKGLVSADRLEIVDENETKLLD